MRSSAVGNSRGLYKETLFTDFNVYLSELLQKLDAIILEQDVSSLKKNYAPVRARIQNTYDVAHGEVTKKIHHAGLIAVLNSIQTRIDGLKETDAALDKKGENPELSQLETVREEFTNLFIQSKQRATFLVLLSSCARLLERLLPSCQELKSIIDEIDVYVTATEIANVETIKQKYEQLHRPNVRLLSHSNWLQVEEALKSNTYLGVDIADEVTWLDKMIEHTQRSFTLNPFKHVTNTAALLSDVDIAISTATVDGVIAPFSVAYRIPFTSIKIGLKDDLARVNGNMSERGFSSIPMEFSRKILRYRLPRESTGRTSQSTNCFTTILTRGNEAVSERDSLYMTFCHGNASAACLDIIAADIYALEYMKQNPQVKRIVVSAADYVGSAATKGKPVSMEEVAEDTIRLLVKHWIRTKGFVGNDLVVAHSLGGLISSIAVDNLHNKDGLPVLYCSLDSLAHPGNFIPALLSDAIPRVVALGLVKLFAGKYDVNPVTHVTNIPKEDRMVICKFRDRVIPFSASLFANLPGNAEILNSPQIKPLLTKYFKNKNRIDDHISGKNLFVSQDDYSKAIKDQESLKNQIINLINACDTVDGFLIDDDNHNASQTFNVGIALSRLEAEKSRRLLKSDLRVLHDMHQHISNLITPAWFGAEDATIKTFKEAYQIFYSDLMKPQFAIDFPRARVLAGFLYEVSRNEVYVEKVRNYILKYFEQGKEIAGATLTLGFAKQCAAKEYIQFFAELNKPAAVARP